MNVLITTGTITIPKTFATTFHKPTTEANTHVRFGYGALTIFYHNLGQVSGSMNADTITQNSTINKIRLERIS